MRIIYNNLIPIKGYIAIMLFGIIFARKAYNPLGIITINHERIHEKQAKQDYNSWIIYYMVYIFYSIKYGYHANPFEVEAYNCQEDLEYINTREKKAWVIYL